MGTNTHSRSNYMQSSNNEDLFVFGYACKLFRDNTAATEVEKTLLPWHGHSDIMIDRLDELDRGARPNIEGDGVGRGYEKLNSMKWFDGRGHLYDISQFNTNTSGHVDMSESEAEFEIQLDYERYCDLYATPEVDTEEEVKRFTEEISRSESGSYNAVGFSYEGNVQPDTTDQDVYDLNAEPMGPRHHPDLEQAMVEPFIPSDELKVLFAPATLMPALKRQQQIIERTAAFISKAGEQMEIKMKMDKAKDSQFAFLLFDNDLNSYYKQLVRLIKSGKYKPVIEEAPKRCADNDSNSDEDSDDDNYLHPSLFGNRKRNDLHPALSSQPQVNVYETSYGKLLERLKPIVTPKVSEKVPVEEKKPVDNPEVQVQSCGRVIPPPPDVKIFVDKLADYVARNGPAFEDKVKQREDNRFDFVKPDNIYYAYYRQRVSVSQKAWVDKMKQKIKFELHQKPEKPNFFLDGDNSLDAEFNISDSNEASSSVASGPNIFGENSNSETARPTADQAVDQKQKAEEQQRLNKLLSLARERYAKIQSERKLQQSQPNEAKSDKSGEHVAEKPERTHGSRKSRSRSPRRRSVSSRHSTSSSESSRDRRRSRSRSRSRNRSRRHSNRRKRHHDRRDRRDRDRRDRRDRDRSSSRRRSKKHRSRSRYKESKASQLIVEGPALPPPGTVDLPEIIPVEPSKPEYPKMETDSNAEVASEDEVWQQLEMLDDNSSNATSKDNDNMDNGDEVVMVLGNRKPQLKVPIVAEPIKLGEEIKAINVLQRLKALRSKKEEPQISPASLGIVSQELPRPSFVPPPVNVPRIPYTLGGVRASPQLLKTQEDIKNSILNKLKQSFQSS